MDSMASRTLRIRDTALQSTFCPLPPAIRSSLLSLEFFYAITVLREISPRKPALAALMAHDAEKFQAEQA